MAVSKRLRFEILRRDNHTCRYCGASAPDVPLRVDHVTPVALGGADTPDNLVTSCEPCNSGKSSATVDSAVVASVSDDALRWADAMKQAAEELRAQQAPKVEYRKIFERAWNEWTWENDGKKETFTLPTGWKSSLDAFRTAGLPHDVWPDIVEKTMTNKTVQANNLFRYACGIGWRMVRELQDRARVLVSPTVEPSSALSFLGQAAVDFWVRDWNAVHEGQPAVEARAEFARSVAEFENSGDWAPPEEIIKAAVSGAGDRLATLQDCLFAFRDQQRADIVIDWVDAWCDLDGASTLRDTPDTFLYALVQDQVNELADHAVSLDRIRRAAILAGFHRSTELHHGLRPNEIEYTGVDAFRQRAGDIWTSSFHAAANRWPQPEERGAFLAHYDDVVRDGDFYLNDVLLAAAAAGAYQDPDLTTCLPRHLSVFEAAARPLAPQA